MSLFRRCLALWIGLLSSGAVFGGEAAEELSSHLGETPALVVVACGETGVAPETVRDLIEKTPWIILVRGPASPELERIRDRSRTEGILGSRVYVADAPGGSLWLAGDLADAVWVAPGNSTPPQKEEILRVLRPGGVGIVAGETLIKPAPSGVDEWRHPYHAPDNNIVSRDRVARLPGELRFQTQPVFAAMPNQTLFAGGRIFFFTGHIAFHEREEPLLNTLTVLNAYNGLRLWSRPLDPDHVVHNVAKFATDREVVYAEGEAVRVLDAVTGVERGTFRAPADAALAGDGHWKWLVQEEDGGSGETRVWAALGPPDGKVAPHRMKNPMGHWPWNVADDQYRSVVRNFGAARTLVSFRFPEMDPIWSIREPEPFDARALCMEDGRIFLMAPGKYLAARDGSTGSELWRRTVEESPDLFEGLGSALQRQGWGLGWATYCWARASSDVVCIAGPTFRKMACVSFEDGDILWTSDLESPHPFFFDDALYVMPRVSGAAGARKVEPRTGKMLEQYRLGVIGSCTRLTVTPHQFFYRPGGGEGRTVYVELPSMELAPYEGIVRPGCFDGVVPANGRLYWMPLACDCWQVHGTFSMAPRAALEAAAGNSERRDWAEPASSTSAREDDWPQFRADAAGTAATSASVGMEVREAWRRPLPGGGLTAPVSVNGRVFVGAADGTVRALESGSGKVLWQLSTPAAVMHPPVYGSGRLAIGGGDGVLYCMDAATGRELGRLEMAPERRLVNIMNRLVSAWPLGGGVVLDEDGIVYAAAGSTSADGAVVAAVDITDGKCHWKEVYTLDRKESRLSFGVQSNLLLKDGALYINGGAPVGIVALDAATGESARVVSRNEAGREMFLEPDGRPSCTGPELYSGEFTRTTIFKRHQGRTYFPMGDRHVALVRGRLFCSRDLKPLDRIVELMNQDPKTGGRMGGLTVPRNVMTIPRDESLLWAGERADVRGLAIGRDGVVALHEDCVQATSPDGKTLWTVPLPATPVRWGIALTGEGCFVTLTNGLVMGLNEPSD